MGFAAEIGDIFEDLAGEWNEAWETSKELEVRYKLVFGDEFIAQKISPHPRRLWGLSTATLRRPFLPFLPLTVKKLSRS
jgi:hypothetical protein